MSGVSAPYRFPLDLVEREPIAPAYAGPVDIWDIDQTYLDTRLRRWRDLIATALESAEDKRARPGVVPLLHALRRGTDPERPCPLYFVSASPPQLRPVLEQKLAIDGIPCNGMALKDHLALLGARRLREIRRHVGYKLSALLLFRARWPAGAREWLYGDDGESDPVIYATYRQIRRGELAGEALEAQLAELQVDPRDRAAIARLAEQAQTASPPPPGGSVEAIYIVRTDPTGGPDLDHLPGVCVVRDAAELARRLAERGRIDDRAVEEVTAAVREQQPR
ncbi:MAG: hypothetical protein D6776_00830 [Planctomycetota bacterium]|nr:MAG: hypothetical protein D6776_00830 [Planctomycetota bacterium]